MIRKHFFLLCASALLLGACGENKKSSASSSTVDSNANANTKYAADKANLKIDGKAKDGTELEVTIDADKIMSTSNMSGQ